MANKAKINNLFSSWNTTDGDIVKVRSRSNETCQTDIFPSESWHAPNIVDLFLKISKKKQLNATPNIDQWTMTMRTIKPSHTPNKGWTITKMSEKMTELQKHWPIKLHFHGQYQPEIKQRLKTNKEHQSQTNRWMGRWSDRQREFNL